MILQDRSPDPNLSKFEVPCITPSLTCSSWPGMMGTLLFSIESWLFNRDLSKGLWNNPHITGQYFIPYITQPTRVFCVAQMWYPMWYPMGMVYYVPTFSWFSWQMWVNIPHMDPMDIVFSSQSCVELFFQAPMEFVLSCNYKQNLNDWSILENSSKIKQAKSKVYNFTRNLMYSLLVQYDATSCCTNFVAFVFPPKNY